MNADKEVKFDYDATEAFADDIRPLLKKDCQDGTLTFEISSNKNLINYVIYLNQYLLTVVQFNIPATEITSKDLRHEFDKAIRENYRDLGAFLALQWFFNDDERAECGINDLVVATNEVLKNEFALKDLQANIKRRCFVLNVYEVDDCDNFIEITFEKNGLIDGGIKVYKGTHNIQIKGDFTHPELKELLEVEDAVVGFIKNYRQEER